MLRQCGVSMRSIVALGLAAGLLAAGCSATSPRRPTSPSTEPTAGAGGAATAPAREVPRPMLVWTPSRLPAGFAARVGALPGVRHAVAVVSGTVWLAQSLDGRGQVVDRPRAGMAIPLDLAGAAPQALAPLLPAADRRLLAALERGEAILGATSARLRRLGPGGMLQIGPPLRSGALGRDALARRAVRIARVVADQDIGAHELLVSRRAAATLGQTIDPAWVARHIVTAQVPILGRVTCNRAVIPQLRGALAEVARRGLANLVDPGGYAGCYAARVIAGDPGPSIAHHAWGSAIDLNARANPQGLPPHQDPRLVRIFERWGFTWGGRWLVPDGMHFELLRLRPIHSS